MIPECKAICVSNTGAACKCILFERLGIESSENTLREEDKVSK